MKKQFINEILCKRIVDTRKYRYVAQECYNDREQWIEIRRIPLSDLDTTAALADWETVKVIRW